MKLVEAAIALLVGATLVATEALAFGWRLGDQIGEALAGTAVLAAVEYFFYATAVVPRGSLPEAPRAAEVVPVRPDRYGVLRLLGTVILCIPAAWLLDRLDVGAFVLPGYPCGYALAQLIVVARIRWWERANGRRVLFEPYAERSQTRPYAGPRL